MIMPSNNYSTMDSDIGDMENALILNFSVYDS